MPYRRLPTTDKARLRALYSALKKSEVKNGEKNAFSNRFIEELNNVKTTFENELKQYELNIQIQSDKNKDYKVAFDKAKMYLSHFIQVLYMAIDREEINPDVLKYYGLDVELEKIPSLNTEEEILDWGQKIVEGDKKRIQKGGNAIYNPSIALVKFKVEEFNDAAIFQHNLKRNTARSYEKMQKLRKSTNGFVSRLWTEIEETIITDSPKEKRQRGQEYGIVYVFRKKEKKNMSPEELQTNLLFDFG